MSTGNTIASVAAGLVIAHATTALGCGAKNTPPPAAPERKALVAQPCSELELGTAAIDPSNARVFVEIAEVDRRDLPAPIGRWLDENMVQMRSSANLVAFPNVPTSMPWGQCIDTVCASMKRSLTLTARLPALASDPIELALRVDEAGAEGTGAGARVLLDTTLRAPNQQPVVLPPAAELSDGSVIVTAYLLRRHDDLQRILQCKQRQSEREQQSR